ncbi:MAG: DnaA N-terminal domain-containing protein, partial [Rhodospirillales bacterium]|nr:DnaA N-terminal domain-containing protein [Rhodospirillales bacterium]
MDDCQLQTHQLDMQWCRVCSRLKAEIGDSAFDNWLKPLKVYQLEGSELNLAVPSRFMRDWIL